jgi:glycosyltransferase involved in cell wall biosynthesis
MKILGLISSYNDPASRFRILQYQNYMDNLGAKLQVKTFFPPKESDPPKALNVLSKRLNRKTWRLIQYYSRKKYFAQQRSWDLLWQNRLMLYNSSAIEKQIKTPRVFDFDDAIWLTEGKEQVDAAIATADLVFAGNEFLADYAIRLNESTELVPTTVDTNRYFHLDVPPAHFNLGWIGTPSNFQYLDMIREPLLEFLRRNDDARLIIVSSQHPEDFPVDGEKILFRQWSAEKENELINEFTVGLMPLANNEWTKGKCSAKMLQYMACGKPVIVSPFGNNAKIMAEANVGLPATNKEEWLAAFHKLKHEPGLSKELGHSGRVLAANKYSAEKWAIKIHDHFKLLIQ